MVRFTLRPSVVLMPAGGLQRSLATLHPNLSSCLPYMLGGKRPST
jgi:hypothetical protein